MFYFDPWYLILVALPGMLIAGGASLMVRAAFGRYSRVPSRRGITGAQAARMMLDRAGVTGVEIVPTHGYLSDHYNPMTKQLALSDAVYADSSLAAIGVACHEAGHAIQHAQGYVPLWLRSAIVPLAGIGSNLGYLVMGMGVVLNSPWTVLIGVGLFSGVLLFQIVTLPVEFDASARAKRLAVDYGIVGADERGAVATVLNAAAMTYVAAVVSSLLTVIYYLWRAGLLGGRSNDE